MSSDSLTTLQRLVNLIAGFWLRMLLAAILGFATIASSIGLMMTSAFIIAKAALHPSIADLQIAIVGVRFFGISRGLFRYLERYVSHDLNFRLLARIRVWLYQHLEPLAPARLQDFQSGDLLARFIDDVDELENVFIRVISPPMVALAIILLTGALLSALNAAVAITVVLMLLLSATLLPVLIHWLTRRVGREQIEIRAQLNAHLVAGIQGLADILAYGAEDRYLEQIERLNHATGKVQTKLGAVSALHESGVNLFMHFSVILALALAIPAVSVGQLHGVNLAVIALGVMAAFEAIQPLPLAMQRLSATLAAARRIFHVIDTPPAVQEPPSPLPCPHHATATLTIENLSFRYEPDAPPALQHINLALPPGKRMAIVGPSGAGKSTLIGLLMRFWDYDQGQIKLGDRDIRACASEDVRAQFSVVSQNTHLFNATIRENLRLAQPRARDEDLWEALSQAQLADFVQSLPLGLDTWIGEFGLQLSGGERQRLAIARALLKNAPILLLDEPTANLDAITEQAFWRDLAPLISHRSVLLITHRAAGLELMDEIITLRDGHIVNRSVSGDPS